jgi:hypothetical protein
MGYWDCVECGTKGILGLPFCPQCKAPNPEEVVPEAPAAPEFEPESGTQGKEASAGVPPESQVQVDNKAKKGGSNAKGE